MEARYKLNSPPVVLEAFEEETILVNLDTGIYYDLNRTGGQVLRALGAGSALGGVIETLADGYEVETGEFSDAVRKLVADLVNEGIITLLDDDAVAQSPTPDRPAPLAKYGAPKLRKFTDMQELLLLDPVHDVNEAGWPHPS